MKSILAALLIATLIAAPVMFTPTVRADDTTKDEDRIRNAGQVVKEIMNIPDNIPQSLIDKAYCVIVFPSVLKAAFIVGGSYGRGLITCRKGRDFSGSWSAPAMFALEAGSVGFQIGGQAADIVMLIMNDRGMENLLQSKFKLGADASVAAGPVGRHADASTDWKLRAQVLTYSRTRGVFAGISINGAVITQHKEDTRDFYGRMVPFRTILLGNVESPKDAEVWRDTLRKYAGK